MVKPMLPVVSEDYSLSRMMSVFKEEWMQELIPKLVIGYPELYNTSQ